ncbi:MAG: hypothetical protein M3256_18395, partial [Actinomycetota bacterium]|nr:hypothetical protein [Actinomycetota bacterium]
MADSAITGNSVVGVPNTSGAYESDGAQGGGIFSVTSLVLRGTTISGNWALAEDPTPGAHTFANGGGIFVLGNGIDQSFTNSTICGNRLAVLPGPPSEVVAQGGGIFSALRGQPGEATATNLTVTGNSGADIGSGVGDGGDFKFTNSIIAGNTGAPQCRGGHSGPYNLDDDGSCFSAATSIHANPLLGPLADNGGPTMTHALLAGSPAIDAVGAGCPPPATDQRGVTRPQGPTCDIGAFEAAAGVPRPTTTTTFGTT